MAPSQPQTAGQRSVDGACRQMAHGKDDSDVPASVVEWPWRHNAVR